MPAEAEAKPQSEQQEESAVLRGTRRARENIGAFWDSLANASKEEENQAQRELKTLPPGQRRVAFRRGAGGINEVWQNWSWSQRLAVSKREIDVRTHVNGPSEDEAKFELPCCTTRK